MELLDNQEMQEHLVSLDQLELKVTQVMRVHLDAMEIVVNPAITALLVALETLEV